MRYLFPYWSKFPIMLVVNNVYNRPYSAIKNTIVRKMPPGLPI